MIHLGADRLRAGVMDGAGDVALTYSGTLLGADNVEGPYAEVVGASSPWTVTADQTRRFYQSQE